MCKYGLLHNTEFVQNSFQKAIVNYQLTHWK